MKYTKKIIALLLAAVALLAVDGSHAQDFKKCDSILKTSTGKIYANPDNVIRSGHRLIEEARGNVGYTIKAYKLISDAYSSKRDYEKSLEYVTKASELLDQSDDELLKICIVNKTGILYHQLKVYDKAVQYLDQAEQLISEYPTKDSIHVELAKNYMVRGFIYKEKLSCTIAIAFLDRGIAELRKSKLELENYSKISIAIYNKGNCYLILKNNALALANFEEAARIAKEINANSLEAFALKGSAQVYTIQGKYAEAIAALNKAVELASGVNDLILNQEIYNGLATNYLATDQLDLFMVYQKKFVEVQKLIKDRERTSVSESLKEKEAELKVSQSNLKAKFYYLLSFLSVVSIAIVLFFCVLIKRKRKEIETIKSQIQLLQDKKGKQA